MLRFEGITTTGTVGFDSGIGDLALKTLNGDTYLYAATGPGGGITAWQLQPGTAPLRHDNQVFASTISAQAARKIMPLTLGGTDYLALDINTATGLVSYDLTATGQIGTLGETAALDGGGNVSAVTQVTVGSKTFVTLAHETKGWMITYLVNPDGTLKRTSTVAGPAVAMETVQANGETYVVTADPDQHGVSIYTMDTARGRLALSGSVGVDQGLGVNTPTAMETIEVHGQTWIILAAANSSTLSVMRIGADGQLIPTDHILDTLSTRFEKVQDLAVVRVKDHVFIVAGGGDDGLSLFTLSPDGKLIYLDSYADTLQSGLQNVQALAAAYVGTDLQIFAAAQEDAGLTQMSVSLANLGVVHGGNGTQQGTAGDDMLSGGSAAATLVGAEGNDILIAGQGATVMLGGPGADTFVMRMGSGETGISDFDPGTDRLDLSDYPMLRNLGQLTVTPTAQGAEVTYHAEKIVIYSATGAPLEASDLFGSGLIGPDHILFFDIGDGGSDGGGTGGGDTGGGTPSPGVTGQITIAPGVANPALSDAEIRFTPSGGTSLTAQADAQGNFDLPLPAGSVSGQLDIVKSYSTASAQITAMDALQVLRIAVGLDPTWGPAEPTHLIAADITRDGTINALDALEVLRAAVGLQSNHSPEWVFLDVDVDLSGITPTSVRYTTGVPVSVVDGGLNAEMTSILLGNMEA